MTFVETKHRAGNHDGPPDKFIEELVTIGRKLDIFIFEPNNEPGDVFNILAPILGPWQSLEHRRAALFECLRVHAMFESDCNWREGVDVTNKTSQEYIAAQETGFVEVSFNSELLGHAALRPFALAHDIATAEKFIPAMKENHPLAVEYYFRLIRFNYQWAGPLIDPARVRAHLWKPAVAEFQALLA